MINSSEIEISCSKLNKITVMIKLQIKAKLHLCKESKQIKFCLPNAGNINAKRQQTCFDNDDNDAFNQKAKKYFKIGISTAISRYKKGNNICPLKKI